jgi:hypothetical protein
MAKAGTLSGSGWQDDNKVNIFVRLQRRMKYDYLIPAGKFNDT